MGDREKHTVQNNVVHAGEGILTSPGAWSFAGQTSEVFDTHVSKSVPLYLEGHELTVALSDFFVKDGSVIHELGCSTGTLLEKLARRHKAKGCRFVGLDSEPDMVKKAETKCSPYPNVKVQVQDITEYDFEPSDLIISYYCLQFVPLKRRGEVLRNIFDSLTEGGALIIFEKVRFDSSRMQDLTYQLYQEYKLGRGYSEEEIMAKSLSLRSVLEPRTTTENYDTLYKVGFKDVATVQKYLCFEGLLATK